MAASWRSAACACARFCESVSAEAGAADIAATTATPSTANTTSARVDGAQRRAWPRANDMDEEATKARGGLQRLTVRYRTAMPPVARIRRCARYTGRAVRAITKTATALASGAVLGSLNCS